MADTISNMQLAYLNFKPHGGKILIDLIDHVIGVCFYPPPGSEHYKLLHPDKFHGSTHINDEYRNNDNKKIM